MATTGKYSMKPYKCTHCGHVRQAGTNHWGEIYSQCPECSWKRPMDATVSMCLESPPPGIDLPEPWKIMKLGDVCKIGRCP